MIIICKISLFTMVLRSKVSFMFIMVIVCMESLFIIPFIPVRCFLNSLKIRATVGACSGGGVHHAVLFHTVLPVGCQT